MIERRTFLTGLAAALALGAPALAQEASRLDQIIEMLKSQGYTRISTSRTLLGRTRILALGVGMRREIVLNEGTGEILRDFWEIEEEDEGDDHRGARDGDDDDGRRGGDDDDDHDDDHGDDDSGGGDDDDDD